MLIYLYLFLNTGSYQPRGINYKQIENKLSTLYMLDVIN